MDGPTEYVQPHKPDTTPGTPDQLWDAFATAAGFEPRTTGEKSAWKKITTQWATDGLTVTDIKRAVAGFKFAHKGEPVHIWHVNHGISAYIALMTPRDAERQPDDDRSRDVPPPPDVVAMFGARRMPEVDE